MLKSDDTNHKTGTRNALLIRFMKSILSFAILVLFAVFSLEKEIPKDLGSRVDGIQKLQAGERDINGIESTILHYNNYSSTGNRRKPVFFFHISKAGGTYINNLAERNGELRASMRWHRSPCASLTNCASDITWIHYEHAMGELSPEELQILFPTDGKDGPFLTFVQLREPRSLEESWYKEIKFGYKHPAAKNTTFLDYIQPDFKKACHLKRMNTLLLFLGSDNDFGEMPSTRALNYSLDYLSRFDVVTLRENPSEHNQKIFQAFFGWKIFDKSGPSRGNNFDTILSQENEIMLEEMLKPDRQVYQYAKKKSSKLWHYLIKNESI